MKSLSRVIWKYLSWSAMTMAVAIGSVEPIAAEGDSPAASPSASTSGSTNKPARTVEERVKIKPYTGPAILLDEAKQVAKPTVVGRETISDKYEDGKVRVERGIAKFSDNHFEAEGIYREYYPSGQVFVEGQFKGGRQEGDWTYYFENGKENRKATYKNGQPDGAWEVHRVDGTLSAKRGFHEGLRDGEWIYYNDKGDQPLREEHYDKGKKDGVWKVWFPSGKQHQEAGFKQDKKDGMTTEWNEDGSKRAEIPFVEDKIDGTATAWLPDGRTIVQVYKAGKLISEEKK